MSSFSKVTEKGRAYLLMKSGVSFLDSFPRPLSPGACRRQTSVPQGPTGARAPSLDEPGPGVTDVTGGRYDP